MECLNSTKYARQVRSPSLYRQGKCKFQSRQAVSLREKHHLEESGSKAQSCVLLSHTDTLMETHLGPRKTDASTRNGAWDHSFNRPHKRHKQKPPPLCRGQATPRSCQHPHVPLQPGPQHSLCSAGNEGKVGRARGRAPRRAHAVGVSSRRQHSGSWLPGVGLELSSAAHAPVLLGVCLKLLTVPVKLQISNTE